MSQRDSREDGKDGTMQAKMNRAAELYTSVDPFERNIFLLPAFPAGNEESTD